MSANASSQQLPVLIRNRYNEEKNGCYTDDPTKARQLLQYLFQLKNLLDNHFEELSRIITDENEKTLSKALGEMRRGIENVEVAIGIPTMMQGGFLEDIATGVDEHMIRQPDWA